jgi:hypothetical protein
LPTEWLKVMLEEIARKRDDAARAREELERRREAREPLPPESAAPAGTARGPA